MKNFKYNLLQKIITVLVITSLFNINIKSQIVQSPGGTALDTELWISSNDIFNDLTPSDLSDVTLWKDRSSNGYNFVKNGSDAVPNYDLSKKYNFEPAVSFYASSTNADGDPVIGAADIRRKLVSIVPFALSASKSYYIFWVSSLSSSYYSGVSYPTVFSFGNYTTARINSVGWYTYGDRLRINSTTRGTQNAITTASATNNNSVGIGISIVPNVPTTSVRQSLYFDGSLISTPAGRAMFTGTYSPTVAILGNSNLTTANPFYGEVYEVIVLSSTSGNTISTIDLNKINSYLAIKYGLTLPGDYVNSDGEVIWSDSKNVGYTNGIFGIGRDDVTGLLKKQSKSDLNSDITLFVGHNLADLNDQNTSTFFSDKDKTYLVLGKNDVVENVSYVYSAGQTFLTSTLETDINERSGSIYKAQITGASSLSVNLKLGASCVLVSNDDATFAPENTRVYPVVDGVAKDVVINDGDLISYGIYTYAPGGVIEGLKVWLRADKISSLVLENVNDVSVWKDQTSSANNFSYKDVDYRGKVYPKYVEVSNDLNFYPTIQFEESSYLAIANGPMSEDAPLDFTSFVAYFSTGYASNVRLYTHGFGSSNPRAATNRRPAMGFAPGEGVGRIRNSGGATGQTDIDGTLFGYKMGTAALQMINTHKANGVSGAGYAIHDFGGWQEKVTATGLTGDGFKMASGGVIGGASIASGSFQGYIPELFFYERALNNDEQDKLKTYLGIKYAITLDKDGSNSTVNYDYKLSDGTIVWAGDSLPNQNYHNNIAGIVRDDASELFNNKARSSSNGATMTMSVSGHNEAGQGKASELPEDMDLSGLFWGHNGSTTTVDLVNNTDVCGDFDFRTGRIWLVDKTKLTDLTVDIRIDNSDYFTWASDAYEVYLLVASDETDMINNKWNMTIPTTFDGTSHVVKYKFTNKYTYLALGIKPKSGTCTTCQFQGVKSIQFDNSTWSNGTTSETYNLGDDFVATINTTIESPASYVSSYPRSYTASSLNQYRTGNTSSKMTTNITLSTATASTFQIFEIDRLATRYDNVKVYGYCGNTLIYPQLSYGVTDFTKRSYSIFNDYSAVAKLSPSVAYSGSGGLMYVDFDVPVDRIVIEHTVTGATTGTARIGLGPIEFSCPPPLPPINEDGLVITNEGPTSALLCDDITYSFRIYNANCTAKSVNFSDILPDGMEWVENSLSIDTVGIGSNTIIKNYANSNTLAIEGLIVPGARTLLFRATARFNSSAEAGSYRNQASIDYEIIENNTPISKSTVSCDRMNSNEGCLATTVIATAADKSPSRLIVEDVIVSKSAYRENDEIKVTVIVNNPNLFPLQDAALNVIFNEEFTYVPNSLNSTTVAGLNLNQAENGYIYIDGFSIPTGSNTITFSVKAPEKEQLAYNVNSNGNTILDSNSKPSYSPLDIKWNIFGKGSDVCTNSAFSEIDGQFDIPYATFKTYVISNKHVTGRIKK